MVEIITKIPRTVRSGDERVLTYDPSEATPDDKLVVMDRATLLGIINSLLTGGAGDPLSAAMGALLNARQQQLDALLQVLTDRIDAMPGGGGGSGAEPVTPTAPVLPASVTFNVPSDYPDDAIAGWIIPSTAGFPQPTYEMQPAIPGITLGAYGDFILTDPAAFFAAIDSAPLDTVVTASNDVGSSVCTVTFDELEGVYNDLMVGQDNLTLMFNAQDNDLLYIDSANEIVEWGCLADPLRKARNDYYLGCRPTRAKSSLIAAGVPAARYQSASIELPYGLYHPERPHFHGIQMIRFNGTSGKQIVVTTDDIRAGRAGSNFPLIVVTPDLRNQPIMLTAYWTTAGLITLRMNGVEIGTTDMVGSGVASTGNWDLPRYPGVAIAVVYSLSLPTSSSMICDGTGIGNKGWTWKRSNWHGDIGFLASWCNVTAKFIHPAEGL